MSAERVTDLDDARKRRQLEEDRVRLVTAYEMGKEYAKNPPPAAPFSDIKSRFNPAKLSLATIILSVWTLTLAACTLILAMAR